MPIDLRIRAFAGTTLSDPDSFRSLRLPKSKTLFIYCRGRYCSLASQAVRILRREGYKAFRLRESAFRLRMIQGGVR